MTTRRASASRERVPGFTLIEVLAVIVIISLVAGVCTVALASTAQSARLNAAAARWRDLDAHARLFARTVGPVTMSLNESATAVRLHRRGSQELASELRLPPGARGRLRADQSSDSVLFDSFGRSVDYEVEMYTDDRLLKWRVLGMTGAIRSEDR